MALHYSIPLTPALPLNAAMACPGLAGSDEKDTKMDAMNLDELQTAPKDLTRRRTLANARRARELERVSYVSGLMQSAQEIARLRAWIERQGNPSGDTEFTRMLAWARNHLAALEGDISQAQIADRLGKNNLFLIPDNLADPVGDPPLFTPWGR